MGRIRGKDIKAVAFDLHDAYPEKFSEDFEQNKRSVNELNLFDSKKKRNRVAGYVVRVVRNAKRKK
ncbi:MAG: 30S ribosomal protein S17e [Candidatus Aenigmarchaeota archaeon]|nr:30S ribosomal protein S17e [Candidatus Aenigmarchaeota archaeon]